MREKELKGIFIGLLVNIFFAIWGMKLFERYFLFVSCWVVLAMALTVNSCESRNQQETPPGDANQLLDFPPFVTPVETYFETRIGEIPAIENDSYRLKISGAVNNPADYSLEELKSLKMFERTLTKHGR